MLARGSRVNTYTNVLLYISNGTPHSKQWQPRIHNTSKLTCGRGVQSCYKAHDMCSECAMRELPVKAAGLGKWLAKAYQGGFTNVLCWATHLFMIGLTKSHHGTGCLQTTISFVSCEDDLQVN